MPEDQTQLQPKGIRQVLFTRRSDTGFSKRTSGKFFQPEDHNQLRSEGLKQVFLTRRSDTALVREHRTGSFYQKIEHSSNQRASGRFFLPEDQKLLRNGITDYSGTSLYITLHCYDRSIDYSSFSFRYRYRSAYSYDDFESQCGDAVRGQCVFLCWTHVVELRRNG